MQKQVGLLKSGLKWRLLVSRGMVLAFILLTELLMWYRLAPGFDAWHQRSLLIRMAVYTGYFLFFYLLTRFTTHYRYKKHMVHLQALIEQMQ